MTFVKKRNNRVIVFSKILRQIRYNMNISIKVNFFIVFLITSSAFDCTGFRIVRNNLKESTNATSYTLNWLTSVINKVQDSIIGDQDGGVLNFVNDFNGQNNNLSDVDTVSNNSFYTMESALQNAVSFGSSFLNTSSFGSSWFDTNDIIPDTNFYSHDEVNGTDYEMFPDISKMFPMFNNLSYKSSIYETNKNTTFIQSAAELMDDVSEIISMFGEETNSSVNKTHDNTIWSINNFVEDIEDMMNSPWMNKSLNHVSILMENLKNKVTYQDNSFLTLLFILQRIQQLTQEKERFQHNSTSAILDSEMEIIDLNRVKRYGKVAMDVYLLLEQSNPEIAEWLGIREDDILKTMSCDDDADQHCPRHLIYVDHEQRTIVMVIQGTWGIRDTIMDLVFDSVPFLDGWAHRGILDGARKVVKDSGDIVKDTLMKFPNYTLVLTGHSMGGGAAELIAMDMLYGDSGRELNFSKNDQELICYAFGAPPVFASNHTKVPVEIPDILSFVNRADVVPTLSLASLEKTLLQISALDSLKFSLVEKSQLMFDNVFDGVSDRCSFMKQALKNLFETDQLRGNLENMFTMVLDKVIPGNMKFLDNMTDASHSYETDIDDTEYKNSYINTPPILRHYKSSNYSNEEDNSRSNETLINKSVIYEDEEIFEEDQKYESKLSEALHMLTNWTENSNHIFLEHPCILYQIEDVMVNEEDAESCKTKQILRRLSPEEKMSFVRNIRLDVVNMISDHVHYSYVNALDKMNG